jgi:hypothetical protein
MLPAGGTAAPENCPSNDFRMSADGSECVCKPGLYPVGRQCKQCEPGYMCPEGRLVQCPAHYYQPASQATSCLQCGSTGDENGFYACNRRGFLLQFCDPLVAGSQNQSLQGNCRPCQQCRRPYVVNSEDKNLVGCYRDD